MPIRSINKPARDTIRQAEIAREFRRVQDDADDLDVIEGQGMYVGPWREKLPDGSFGPWYGPATEAAYERELKEYEEKREAGSLWDDEEAAKYNPRQDIERQANHAMRYDLDAVKRLVQRNGHALPRLELRVFYAFWIDAMTVGEIARKLTVAPSTVRECVRRIRKRVKAAGVRRDESGLADVVNVEGLQ
jgi:hypothetical protein